MELKDIKFRVFSKDEGDYYHTEKGNEVEIKFSEDSFSVWVEVQEWESGSGEWIDSYAWRELEGELILEQFTGLKDKNGQDIYAGDVVDNHYVLSGLVRRGKIIFFNGCFVREDDEHNTIEIHSESVKVIGNIHENAELLSAQPTASDLDVSWPSRGLES